MNDQIKNVSENVRGETTSKT